MEARRYDRSPAARRTPVSRVFVRENPFNKVVDDEPAPLPGSSHDGRCAVAAECSDKGCSVASSLDDGGSSLVSLKLDFSLSPEDSGSLSSAPEGGTWQQQQQAGGDRDSQMVTAGDRGDRRGRCPAITQPGSTSCSSSLEQGFDAMSLDGDGLAGSSQCSCSEDDDDDDSSTAETSTCQRRRRRKRQGTSTSCLCGSNRLLVGTVARTMELLNRMDADTGDEEEEEV